MIIVQSIGNVPSEIPETVFIDEAYDAMMQSKIKMNKRGEVVGFMGVPNKAAKTILLSGVKSNQVDHLMEKLYGLNSFTSIEFGSTNRLIDKDDFSLCTVECDNDFDDVALKAIDKVV
jgi:hypothetical protein